MKRIPKLWFITGCTAVGKTEYSLALAKKIDAAILSCDSVQIYKEVNIGSAKIPLSERCGIPHYGFDLCWPNEKFNVGEYQIYAHQVIENLSENYPNICIVGGSGFYLKSFFTAVTDGIEVPQEIEQEVQKFYREHGVLGLQSAIAAFGPVNLNTSDWNNPHRLLHILQKQKVTGLSQVDLQKRFLAQSKPYADFPKKVIYIERSIDHLRKRIQVRIEKMLKDGFLEEGIHLLKKYGNTLNHSLKYAVGYREIFQFVRTGGSTEKLIQAIENSTYQMIKKQTKWFQKQIAIDYRINLDTISLHESFDFMGLIFKDGVV